MFQGQILTTKMVMGGSTFTVFFCFALSAFCPEITPRSHVHHHPHNLRGHVWQRVEVLASSLITGSLIPDILFVCVEDVRNLGAVWERSSIVHQIQQAHITICIDVSPPVY